jgi:hypothetical protein
MQEIFVVLPSDRGSDDPGQDVMYLLMNLIACVSDKIYRVESSGPSLLLSETMPEHGCCGGE